MEKALAAIDSFSSLKALLAAKLGREEIKPPMTEDSVVRCSSVADLCAREEVLRSRLGRSKTRITLPGLELSLLNGTAIHDVVQNGLLPSVGVLQGKWKCLSCSKVHQGKGDNLVDMAIYRPDTCGSCGHAVLRYEEFEVFEAEYFGMKVRGHLDGVLRIRGLPGKLLFELKTIGQDHAWKVASFPMYEHVIQANMYMRLANLKHAIIFYWIKGMTGMESVLDHRVDYDPELTLSIKDTLESLKRGLLDTTYTPERICATGDCERASECCVAKECFEEAA